MSGMAWRLAAAALAFSAAGLALAACSERLQEPPQARQFCPQVVQPVCARDGTRRQTFANACEATAAGFPAYSPGECGPGATPKPDRICPQVYVPVCASAAGRLATYSNDCVAGAAGARVVHQGPC